MTVHFTLKPDPEVLDAAEQIVGVLRDMAVHGPVSGFAYRAEDSVVTLRTAWLNRTPSAAESLYVSVLMSGGLVTERVEDGDGREHLSAEWQIYSALTTNTKEK